MKKLKMDFDELEKKLNDSLSFIESKSVKSINPNKRIMLIEKMPEETKVYESRTYKLRIRLDFNTTNFNIFLEECKSRIKRELKDLAEDYEMNERFEAKLLVEKMHLTSTIYDPRTFTPMRGLLVTFKIEKNVKIN